jgi:Co/Zn/Cd efflux system component
MSACCQNDHCNETDPWAVRPLVLATVAWHTITGTVPEPITMGVIGLAALVSNAVCFGLLYAYRSGDANMRSVWVCSRNDMLGNLAVLLAALGVFGTGTGWPDLIVATVMAALAIQGAVVVVRHAREELSIPGGQIATSN